MGLLDQVIGAVAGGLGQGNAGSALGGGGNTNLLNMVLGMLANNSEQGGLAGLVKQFQQGGLGDVMQSWVSTGQNLPISPEQLSQVFGGDALAKMGSQLGVSGGDLAGQLSQMLPEVVDKLTPNGQVPEGGLGGLGDLGNLLGGLLAKR
jgi:uncharacterized protein YidB (DUF937 family)